MNPLPLPEWLLSWLSVDVESLRGGSALVRFTRFPDGELGLVALVIVAAALAAAVAIYLREGQVPLWRKLVMAAFRSLVLAVMAVIAFYPVLEVNRARDLRAVTLLLVDDSLSFGIKDRYLTAAELAAKTASSLGIPTDALRDRTRAELAAALLNDPQARFLPQLAEQNLLRAYTFSDDLRPLAGEAPRVAVVPRGTRTDLASTLRQAIEEQGGARIAAAVVLTDGRLTGGEGGQGIVSGLGEELRRKGIPLHAVGVGDPSAPRNFKVSAMLVNDRIFAKDPAVVDVSVRQIGYAGETVSVELIDEVGPGNGGGAGRSLGKVDVVFDGSREEAQARLRIELEETGRHRLTARVTPRPEEAFLDDNAIGADVEVIEEASRALLIAGSPSYEYRFLQNLLRRDRRVFVAAWLMSADQDFPQEGDTSLKALPVEAKDLFTYDVVILLDIDPEGLPPEMPRLLEKFVGQHRGGLYFVAGEKHSATFFRDAAMKPIRDMLPVLPDAPRAEVDASDARFFEREWPLVPTSKASVHPATRLSSDPERNRQRWEEVAGVYWSFAVRKTKPAAVTLLTNADPSRAIAGEPVPVLVWQYYEGGRTMFLGTDETWRWRSTVEEVYDQFWMQSVRYLTESRLTGGKRQVLQTDAETYELGDVVQISALRLDEEFRPIAAESLDLRVAPEDGTGRDPLAVRLEPDARASGWFRGAFVPPGLGVYRLGLEGGAEKVVRVRAPDLEFREPELDETILSELALRTGGSYARLCDARDLPKLIPDRRRTVVTTDEPIPLWDNWLSLALLAGLLTIEWILRKWHRLL